MIFFVDFIRKKKYNIEKGGFEMKTSKDLYESFIKIKEEKKLTYDDIGKALNTNGTTIFDKIKRLENGRSVHSKFLFDLEEILGEPIFFGN